MLLELTPSKNPFQDKLCDLLPPTPEDSFVLMLTFIRVCLLNVSGDARIPLVFPDILAGGPGYAGAKSTVHTGIAPAVKFKVTPVTVTPGKGDTESCTSDGIYLNYLMSLFTLVI